MFNLINNIGKNVTVYNRFVMSPAIPGGVTLKLEANATGVSIGGLKETEVTFNGTGISTGGKSVAGVAGFIEFEGKSQTSSTVNKEQSSFVWNVTKITNKTTGTGTALTTNSITFYTVLDVPKLTPWNVSDSSIDNKSQPWVSALEFTIETGNTKGQGTDGAVLSQLTTYLHNGHGLTYDTSNGAPAFSGNYTTALTTFGFNVTGYIIPGTPTIPKIVNCYDQAAALTTFGRLIGIDVHFTFSYTFGYINTTDLVGGISTNNPFFDAPPPSGSSVRPYSTNSIVDLTTNTANSGGVAPPLAAYRKTYDYNGNTLANRSSFGNHAYVTIGTSQNKQEYMVYDACAGPVINQGITDYFVSVVDLEANAHHNARYGDVFKTTADALVDDATRLFVNFLF